jgi:phosphate transport system protein
MTKSHTNKAYESELRTLRDSLILIAGRAEKMVHNSIKALKDKDVELARKTIDYDRTIDREEMIIDRQCIEILARRQPLGQDLRMIVAVLKMVTYFERIGDLAAKICQKVIKLKRLNAEYDMAGIEEMAQDVELMIRETLEAFLHKDSKKALFVIRHDQRLDEVYHSCTKAFLEGIGEGTLTFSVYSHVTSIAKWLERMGDHCTNLAELIIFMVRGEDVRHQEMAKSVMSLE